ncbi:hypothetical protein [Clostridium sp.]|uniref:hypothetical protein n=1 Tax=Clostridium sp. TaxID=1506 RepID=UPI002FC7EFDE
MKLSKREKVLIGILVVASLFYGVNKYVISAAYGKITTLKTEKDNLTATLQKINQVKETRASQNEEFQKLVDEINSDSKSLFPELKYDKITIILDEMLEESNLICDSITFSDIVMESVQVPVKEEKIEDSEINKLVKQYLALLEKTNDGNVDGEVVVPKENQSSSNSSRTSVDSQAKPSRLIVTINYRGKYKDLNRFIQELEKYEKLILVDKINIAKVDGDQIGGTIELSMYSVDKPFIDDYFKYNFPKPEGVGDPFSGEGAPPDIEGNSKSEKHIYILAKPTSADVSPLSISKYGDDKSAIISTKSIEDLEIVFTEENGKIYYKYKTSSSSYPTNYSKVGDVLKVEGKDIIVEAISTLRNSVQDLSQVNVTIINNTSKTVRLKVTSDDKSRPRIVLASKKGNVLEERK